jgi:hypothetical protein
MAACMLDGGMFTRLLRNQMPTLSNSKKMKVDNRKIILSELQNTLLTLPTSFPSSKVMKRCIVFVIPLEKTANNPTTLPTTP